MSATGSSPKICIIGLDGADWSLLEPLFEDGAMPNLGSFVERSARASLESVYPTNSMSAWTSFMTGVNPGKHGVYEFVRNTRIPFRTHITNSSAVRFPTMFDTIGRAGLRSCVIDMPPLYPPFEINGVMVGGMGALSDPSKPYGWPDDTVRKIEADIGPFHRDVTWVGKAGREEELVDEMCSLVDHRLRLSLALLKEGGFDLFCSVFVAPDRAQHVFWQDLVNRGPRYELARRFYQVQDRAVGSLLAELDQSSTDVLIVSDHGFRPAGKVFDVNQYLLEAGLSKWAWEEGRRQRLVRSIATRIPLPTSIGGAMLKAQTSKRKTLAREAAAYSDQADCVNINLQGREAAGGVPPADFSSVRDRVAAVLLEARDPDTGSNIVRGVVEGEQYFHGDLAGEAPDLVLQFHDGYAYGTTMGKTLFPWAYCQGVHRREGIIAAAGPSFRAAVRVETISIMDVAPTVLSILGVPVPEGTDGRQASEILAQEREVQVAAVAASTREGRPSSYSDEEEAAVRERLRGLGYID